MCGFCEQAELLEDCGVDGLGSLKVTLEDAGRPADRLIPGDITTTATIAVGDSVDESLETLGDKDWFQIDLSAGEWISISLRGVDHTAGDGLPGVEDPLVRLRDSNGNIVATDDDGGVGLNSLLSVSVEVSGTYYIEVDSWRSQSTGNYRLGVTAATAPSPVDAVQGSNWLDDSDTLLVYFAQEGDIYNDFGDIYEASGVNAYEQGQIWSVFEQVETFADIDFEITTNRAAADLEFATTKLASSPSGTLLGFFNFPDSNGDGGFGVLNNNADSFPLWNDTPGGTLDTGGFMFSVIVHELGHGLGLGHPHDNGNGTSVMLGVSDSGDRGDYELNSAPYTIMTYTEGSTIAGVASTTASTGHAASYGALDIAALQNFYGANTSHASGDDIYVLDDSNVTGSGAGYYAIWDTDGTDEIRYNGTSDAVIDLRAATLQYEDGGGGFLSYVDGVIGGRTIANGVVIENATGSSGDDEITGNAADNRLNGRNGDDIIFGLDGRDTLVGAGGSDDMSGGLGNDRLNAGAGNDTVSGGDGRDILTGGLGSDDLFGDEGNDIFRFTLGDGDDYMDGGDGIDVWVARGFSSTTFDIVQSGMSDWTVTHSETGETDILTNIEKLRFDDTVYSA
ncbi:pre-peptidase C-terminal domain-containing protein [Phaeobacter marinintestinus]|uniref:pre-peptidase C-terminal domain-containing protein n=1 Tax=Falsiphaeobacter marinintestinus TaxID=1492905 RepID=UPI0011B7E3BB|nr:pre-peptidase C-terminal domain-containing protein [Phaeobacter marinintestinus]